MAACRDTISISNMQPVLKTRITGRNTTTLSLRATVRATASSTPASSAGGPDHGGVSGCR